MNSWYISSSKHSLSFKMLYIYKHIYLFIIFISNIFLKFRLHVEKPFKRAYRKLLRMKRSINYYNPFVVFVSNYNKNVSLKLWGKNTSFFNFSAYSE
jgi:hypothetical protein